MDAMDAIAGAKIFEGVQNKRVFHPSGKMPIYVLILFLYRLRPLVLRWPFKVYTEFNRGMQRKIGVPQ